MRAFNPAFSFWGLLAIALALLLSTGSVSAEGTSGATAVGPPTFKTVVRAYYPAQAKRLGLTGCVGLEYSVDGKGRARNIVVIESGGQLLDDHAKALLSDEHFEIPADWLATGGPEKRYQVGVIF
jgi:hypothetical protein